MYSKFEQNLCEESKEGRVGGDSTNDSKENGAGVEVDMAAVKEERGRTSNSGFSSGSRNITRSPAGASFFLVNALYIILCITVYSYVPVQEYYSTVWSSH